MRKFSFIIVALATFAFCSAQDVITLVNGEKMYAVNIRFSGDKVYFNRWSDGGPSQSATVVNAKDLSKIIYESGEEEFFQKENPNAKVNINTGNVNTGDKSVNANATGPAFNNGNNGGGQSQQYNGVVSLSDEGRFMDNARFNAYAEGLGALFFVNNMNDNKFYFGANGSAGIRLNNHLFLGGGMGFFISSSNIKNSYDGYYRDYYDAPSWYLPIFADVRFFYTLSDDLSLFGQISAGVEFNSYSRKKEWYNGNKCGKLYLNLAMGMEISKITASMGVVVFQGMYREEKYYDNYYSGDHSHSVGYYKESIPALYLKVGYKFGE